jgi:hypothetical protein
MMITSVRKISCLYVFRHIATAVSTMLKVCSGSMRSPFTPRRSIKGRFCVCLILSLLVAGCATDRKPNLYGYQPLAPTPVYQPPVVAEQGNQGESEAQSESTPPAGPSDGQLSDRLERAAFEAGLGLAAEYISRHTGQNKLMVKIGFGLAGDFAIRKAIDEGLPNEPADVRSALVADAENLCTNFPNVKAMVVEAGKEGIRNWLAQQNPDYGSLVDIVNFFWDVYQRMREKIEAALGTTDVSDL